MPSDQMPIPFGIYADTGLPFDGLDEASLNDFVENDQSDSTLQEYLEVKVSDNAPHLGVVGDIRDPEQSGTDRMVRDFRAVGGCAGARSAGASSETSRNRRQK